MNRIDRAGGCRASGLRLGSIRDRRTPASSLREHVFQGPGTRESVVWMRLEWCWNAGAAAAAARDAWGTSSPVAANVSGCVNFMMGFGFGDVAFAASDLTVVRRLRSCVLFCRSNGGTQNTGSLPDLKAMGRRDRPAIALARIALARIALARIALGAQAPQARALAASNRS